MDWDVGLCGLMGNIEFGRLGTVNRVTEIVSRVKRVDVDAANRKFCFCMETYLGYGILIISRVFRKMLNFIGIRCMCRIDFMII